MGIEPTNATLNVSLNGFEDRGHHQMTGTSAIETVAEVPTLRLQLQKPQTLPSPATHSTQTFKHEKPRAIDLTQVTNVQTITVG